MTRDEIAAVVEMAWEDIRNLDTDRTAIGLAIIVMHKVGDTLDTQLCATTPPEVTHFAVTQMVRQWLKGGKQPFESFELKRRKAV
jgi:hypothetical protein